MTYHSLYAVFTYVKHSISWWVKIGIFFPSFLLSFLFFFFSFFFFRQTCHEDMCFSKRYLYIYSKNTKCKKWIMNITISSALEAQDPSFASSSLAGPRVVWIYSPPPPPTRRINTAKNTHQYLFSNRSAKHPDIRVQHTVV